MTTFEAIALVRRLDPAFPPLGNADAPDEQIRDIATDAIEAHAHGLVAARREATFATCLRLREDVEALLIRAVSDCAGRAPNQAERERIASLGFDVEDVANELLLVAGGVP